METGRRGRVESGEEARGRRAAQGQAGPSAGLRACGACGERLFAQKAGGGTLAAGSERTDWRGGVTQQAALPPGRRGKAGQARRPGLVQSQKLGRTEQSCRAVSKRIGRRFVS